MTTFQGKKSVKDPAAVDFLEKSMIVLTASPSENPLNLLQPKDASFSFFLFFIIVYLDEIYLNHDLNIKS